MDLFSAIINETKPEEAMEEKVKTIANFVKDLSAMELKALISLQKSIDFEVYNEAARGLFNYALSNNLKDTWDETVNLMKAEKVGEFWTPAWDSAFDYSVALLLSPYAGKSFNPKWIEIMQKPLKELGLKL